MMHSSDNQSDFVIEGVLDKPRHTSIKEKLYGLAHRFSISSRTKKREAEVQTRVFAFSFYENWSFFLWDGKKLTKLADIPPNTKAVYYISSKEIGYFADKKLSKGKVFNHILEEYALESVVLQSKKNAKFWIAVPRNEIEELRGFGVDRVHSFGMMLFDATVGRDVSRIDLLVIESLISFYVLVSSDGSRTYGLIMNQGHEMVMSQVMQQAMHKKIIVSQASVNTLDLSILFAQSSGYWRVDENIAGISVLAFSSPLVVIIVGSIAVAGYGLLIKLPYINYVHSEKLATLNEQLTSANSDFSTKYAAVSPYINDFLSLQFRDVVAQARVIWKPGLSMSVKADNTGETVFVVEYLRHQVPLTSFENIVIPDGCTQKLEVNGNGSTARKEIRCPATRTFIGRYNIR